MLQKSSRYRGWVLGFALGVLPASGAYAQGTVESRGWQYRRFDAIDAAVTAAGASIVIAATFVWPPSGNARWNGGILFDDGVRDEIRAESRSGRDNARLVGDVLYIGGGLYPIVVDGFVALVVRQDSDLAAQMLLIDLEAYAVAGALLTGSERMFARARPSAEPCSDDSGYEAFCGEPDSASSMISGHTGIVATSAGLLCAHHQYLGLYGSPAADATICGIGIGMAIGTGVARTINDRHYASDVIAGWLVGGSIGYLLPVLRFYGPGPVKSDRARMFTVLPTATPTSAGAELVGLF
jgi:membrane-associated phospholipid phosphatase